MGDLLPEVDVLNLYKQYYLSLDFELGWQIFRMEDGSYFFVKLRGTNEDYTKSEDPAHQEQVWENGSEMS
jgi:hypothetical protein